MESHVVSDDARHIAAPASNAKSFDLLIQAFKRILVEHFQRPPQRENLNPAAQVHDQWLGPGIRSRTHPDSAIPLGNKQPFLSQLKQDISYGAPADSKSPGQRFLTQLLALYQPS
jgi:hypothetical protein